MKKTFIIVMMIVSFFALVLINLPKNVQAGYTATKRIIAAGTWNTGTEIDVDLTSAPAPEWLQLMTTEAVVLSDSAEICHELGGGNYHWVGEIRQLKDGKWVKLETINGWVPDEEGAYMSCAQAPSAGTYALFAYYNGPQEFFFETEAPVLIPTLTPPICDADGEDISSGCTCPSPRKVNKNICMPLND